MKDINKIIIGGMVVTSVIAANYSVASADQLGTYVTTQRLNMRKGPSTSYVSIGTLYSGAKVDVLEISADGLWAKIKFQAQEVWLSLQYLKKEATSTIDNTSTIKLNSKYEVTAGINIRKGPSTDYYKVGYVSIGHIVVPTEISADKEWVKITHQGTTGWISAAYIKAANTQAGETTTPETEKPEQKPEEGITTPSTSKKYKTTTRLNVRKGPSTAYSKLGYLPMGTVIEVIGFTSDSSWAKIKHNGQDAWVSTQYIKEDTQEQPTTPEAPNKVEVGKKYKTTVAVNARKDSVNTSEILAVLKKGQEVVPLSVERAGYWAKFEYKGQMMYVCTTYLEEVKETEQPETEKPEQKPEETTKPSTNKKYKATASLNVRKGPATSYRIIGGLAKEAVVEVSGFTSDGSWAKINFKGQEGWISAQYIKEDTQEQPTTPEAPNKVEVGKKYKTTVAVNAREDSANTSKILAVLKKGQEVVPISVERAGYWAKFEYKGQVMYVCTTYLEEVKETEQPETEKPSSKKYFYTTVNLNLRKGASTLEKKICVIPANKDVEVLEYSEDFIWCKVVYNGKTGWVVKDYLKSRDENETVRKCVIKSNLNVRKGPSTDYVILSTIPAGSIVEITEELGDGWIKVKYNAYEGYCSEDYITKL